jgi:hypothetical protein
MNDTITVVDACHVLNMHDKNNYRPINVENLRLAPTRRLFLCHTDYTDGTDANR